MSDEDITQVRQLVEAKCEQFNFDDSELDMVFRDDWFVGCFLHDNNGDHDQTAAAILKALVYREKYKIYNIRAQDLPMEMFAWMVKSGRDIHGTKIYWSNYGCHKKIPELADILLKVDYLNLLSRCDGRERYDAYADLRGLSWQSLDMRLTRKSTSLNTTCFPGTINHMYVFGLPVTLTAVIQTLLGSLPARYRDNISFITLDQAKARVSHMEYVEKPKGSNIRKVLQKQNVPEARIDEIIELFACAQRKSDQFFDELHI
ncbi:hypothetical protein HDE_00534 [Halotydeus destructor]|nr:hypothetical protein HDE_00534 [Halotydeus destructor]